MRSRKSVFVYVTHLPRSKCAIAGYLLSAGIVLITGHSHAADSYPFEYKTIFLASSKMNQFFDTDTVVDDYIQLFRPSVWEKYHLDEFNFKKKEDEASAALRAEIDHFDLQKAIVLRTTLTFGKYDTERQGFPIDNFKPGTYWTVDQGCCRIIPSQIQVTFLNIEHFELMPVPETVAKNLVEHRSSGDRQITAEISFVSSKVSGDREVMGTIQHVRFTDPTTGGALIASVTQ